MRRPPPGGRPTPAESGSSRLRGWPVLQSELAHPLRSPLITRGSSRIQDDPPLNSSSVLSPSWFWPLVASPLASKFRFPRSAQPPHGKLRPPLMPDAAPPVNRYRRNSSRSNSNSAVLAIISNFSTLHQWFPCGPLLACHLTRSFPGLFLLRSRPWLLTTAARGGLKPTPASRFRGALPHQLSSYALEKPLGLQRSWHTTVKLSSFVPFSPLLLPLSH